jgi:F-type H+-transporting ATPase subunit b
LRSGLRVLVLVTLLAMALPAVSSGTLLWAAQEGASTSAQAESGHAENSLLGWRIANFAIFLLIVGYFSVKYAPGFFASRNERIRKSIEEGTLRTREADARAAEIDRKLANLQAEVEAMRDSAGEESAKEFERIESETRRLLAKIQEQADQQIALAAKAAQQGLKEYVADLALSLARQRIASPLPTDVERSLVRSFLAHLPQASGPRRPAA